jgi:hypothetical protein
VGIFLSTLAEPSHQLAYGRNTGRSRTQAKYRSFTSAILSTGGPRESVPIALSAMRACGQSTAWLISP